MSDEPVPTRACPRPATAGPLFRRPRGRVDRPHRVLPMARRRRAAAALRGRSGRDLHRRHRELDPEPFARPGISLLGLITIFGVVTAFSAPDIAEQFGQLEQELPRSIENLHRQMDHHRWAKVLLDQLPTAQELRYPGVGLVRKATGALNTTVVVLARVPDRRDRRLPSDPAEPLPARRPAPPPHRPAGTGRGDSRRDQPEPARLARRQGARGSRSARRPGPGSSCSAFRLP